MLDGDAKSIMFVLDARCGAGHESGMTDLI